MPSMACNKNRLPCRQAGEAFFVEARDRLAVKDAGGTSRKPQFEPVSLHPIGISGPVAVRSSGEPVSSRCAALHDGKMVGVHTSRIECDELWSYIGRKQ